MKLKFYSRRGDGLEDNIIYTKITKEDLKKINNELEVEECEFIEESKWGEYEE